MGHRGEEEEEEEGSVHVATVIEEAACHQIIELQLKWKTKWMESGLEADEIKMEGGGGETITIPEEDKASSDQ